MFLPKRLTDKANNYVEGQGDREPRFKRGVGIGIRPSGNILRWTTTSPLVGRRTTDIAAAYGAAQEAKRLKNRRRMARVAKKSGRAA